MRFSNIDQHISVISDIKKIFNSFGHTVRSHNQSGHCLPIGIQPEVFPELQGDNWCGLVGQKNYKEFWGKYGQYLEANTDAYICTFPPVYSMLYKYSKKPIIIDIPIRYEYGVDGDPAGWEELSEYLRQGVDDGRIFLVANNLVDKYYTGGCLNRTVEHIPSFCDYTGMSYNPVRDKWLCYSNQGIIENNNRLIRKHEALSAGHAWQMVGEYQGCVHFPYQVSTMSIFEQYTAGIPLAFPTKRLMMEMYSTKKQTVLDQLSHSRQSKRSGTPIYNHLEKDLNNWHDKDCVSYWLEYADYYNENIFPFIMYFDNIEELNNIINMDTRKLIMISRKMKIQVLENKSMIYSKWSKLLKEVEDV